jgi:hypothetical protein
VSQIKSALPLCPWQRPGQLKSADNRKRLSNKSATSLLRFRLQYQAHQKGVWRTSTCDTPAKVRGPSASPAPSPCLHKKVQSLGPPPASSPPPSATGSCKSTEQPPPCRSQQRPHLVHQILDVNCICASIVSRIERHARISKRTWTRSISVL